MTLNLILTETQTLKLTLNKKTFSEEPAKSQMTASILLFAPFRSIWY